MQFLGRQRDSAYLWYLPEFPMAGFEALKHDLELYCRIFSSVRAIRYTELLKRCDMGNKYLAEESNPVLQIRSLPCWSVTLAR